jgi:hypothetical protein
MTPKPKTTGGKGTSHLLYVVGIDEPYTARSVRSGELDEFTKIARRGRWPSFKWAVATDRRVPLAAIMLMWHSMIGDYENNDGYHGGY